MESLSSITLSKRRPAHVGFWLAAGATAISVLLLIATALNLHASHQTELRRSIEATGNLSRSLAIEVSAEVRLVDQALQTIGNQAMTLRAPLSTDGNARIVRLAQQQLALLPFVDAIRLANSQGLVDTASTGGAPIQIGDRPYFQQAMASADLVISPPLIGRYSGQWSIYMARRLRSSDGEVLGVVYAALKSDYLESLFRKFSLGPDGAIALRTMDFQLVARYQMSEKITPAPIGSSEVSEAFKATLVDHPDHGHYVAASPVDHVDRLYAYQKVPEFPFLLVAGQGTEASLTLNAFENLRYGAFTAVVIVMLWIGTVYAYRQQQREHRAYVQADRLLRQQDLLARNEWVGILRVVDGRIDWCNQAAARMLGYDTSEFLGLSTAALDPRPETFCLPPPEQAPESPVQTPHHQVRLLTRTGSGLWVDLSGSWLTQGESVWVLINVDGLKQSEEEARHHALHDGLTGLANRRLLNELLGRALARAERSNDQVLVCYLDLDGFKPINDRYGHHAGDFVLQTVSDRLLKNVRAGDIVARVGGDEFVVVLTSGLSSTEGHDEIQRISRTISDPIRLPGADWVQVNCSVGVVASTDRGADPDALIQRADLSMFSAKREGPGRIAWSTEPPLPRAHRHLAALRTSDEKAGDGERV